MPQCLLKLPKAPEYRFRAFVESSTNLKQCDLGGCIKLSSIRGSELVRNAVIVEQRAERNMDRVRGQLLMSHYSDSEDEKKLKSEEVLRGKE